MKTRLFTTILVALVLAATGCTQTIDPTQIRPVPNWTPNGVVTSTSLKTDIDNLRYLLQKAPNPGHSHSTYVLKAGDTMSGKLVVPSFQVTGGSPSIGRVLTSDADGNATWQDPSGSIIGTGLGGRLAYWTDSTTLSYDNVLAFNDSTKVFSINNPGYLTVHAAGQWADLKTDRLEFAYDNLTAVLAYDGPNDLVTLSKGLSVTGTVAATLFSGSGASLTNLNASNIASGTLGADYGGAGSIDGILMADGAGHVSQAVDGSDYLSSATGQPLDADLTAIAALVGTGSKIIKWNGAAWALGDDNDTVYTHPTGDGNLHVPATGTTNNGKVLTAGPTAGSISWQTPAATGVTGSGTQNKLPKWNNVAGTTLGDSNISDTGSAVSIAVPVTVDGGTAATGLYVSTENTSTDSSAIYGENTGTSGAVNGIYGRATASTQGVGVWGVGYGAGTYGSSLAVDGVGMYGDNSAAGLAARLVSRGEVSGSSAYPTVRIERQTTGVGTVSGDLLRIWDQSTTATTSGNLLDLGTGESYTSVASISRTGKGAFDGGVKIGTNSTSGHVWTASDTAGNGSWQAVASTHQVVIAASNTVDKSTAAYVCDGSDDQETINNAFAALPATGGEVILLEGLYDISGDITLPSNTILRGNGYGTHVQLEAGFGVKTVDTDMITNVDRVNGNSNIAVYNIRLDGNNDTLPAEEVGRTNGFRFERVNNFIIANNWIEHLGNVNTLSCMAITPQGCTYGIITGNVITDTVDGINTSFSPGPPVVWCRYLTVSNNVVTSTNRDYGINIFRVSDSTFTANVLTNCGHDGIEIGESTNNVVSNNIITGCNQIPGGTYGGILLAYNGPTNCTIIGNVVRSATSGNVHTYGIRAALGAGAGNRILYNDVAGGGTTELLDDSNTDSMWVGNRTTASGTNYVIGEPAATNPFSVSVAGAVSGASLTTSGDVSVGGILQVPYGQAVKVSDAMTGRNILDTTFIGGQGDALRLYAPGNSANATLPLLQIVNGTKTIEALNSARIVTGANPASDADAVSRSYVTGRGMNLFANGSGLMGNNYNWSSLTFDQSDLHGGRGMFTKTGSAYVTSDELIPVDITRTYRLSLWVKTLVDEGDGKNKLYAGVTPLDANGYEIIPPYYSRRPSTETTLAAPLKPGDTTITLTSTANWHAGGSSTYSHITLYGYQNTYGYTYPDYTYSRLSSGNGYSSVGAWDVGGIGGNVITLSAAWPSTWGFIPSTHTTGEAEPTWPTGVGATVYDRNIYWTEAGSPVGGETAWSAGAIVTANAYFVPTVANGHRYQATSVNVFPTGTACANSFHAGTYKYIAASYQVVPTSWTNYTGWIGGIDTTGSTDTNFFPYGTAFVKLLLLCNYSGATTNKQGYSDFWFSEIAGNNIEAASATQQGVVTTGTQTFAGTKTFGGIVTGALKVTGGTPASGKFLGADADGNATWQTPSDLGTLGTGTPNYLAKWTAADTIGDSLFRDDGTNTGIGAAPDANRFLNVSKTWAGADNVAQYGTHISTTYQQAPGGSPTKYGLFVETNATHTTGALPYLYGVNSLVNSDGAGTMTDLRSFRATATVKNGANIGSYAGLQVYNPLKSGAPVPTIGTVYGVKIENMTSGDTNYAIYTGTGASRFGGQVVADGGLKIATGAVTDYALVSDEFGNATWGWVPAPATAEYITLAGNTKLSNEFAVGGLGTGMLKINGYSSPTLAVAGTDFEAPITAGTTAQYWKGDKSWATLDKAAVGLGNVLNIAQAPGGAYYLIVGTNQYLDNAINVGGMGTGLMKLNNTSNPTLAVANTDYLAVNNAAMTGDPTAPTAATGDSDTSVATTAFVKNQNYITSAGTAAKVAHALSQGTGIATFSFDGSVAATVAIDTTVVPRLGVANTFTANLGVRLDQDAQTAITVDNANTTSNARTAYKILHDGAEVGYLSYNNATPNLFLSSVGSIPLNLGTAGSVKATILADGKFGIGTVNPGTALEVNGTVTATDYIGDGSTLSNIPTIASPSFTGNAMFTGTLQTVNGTQTIGLGPWITLANSETNVTNTIQQDLTGGFRFDGKVTVLSGGETAKLEGGKLTLTGDSGATSAELSVSSAALVSTAKVSAPQFKGGTSARGAATVATGQTTYVVTFTTAYATVPVVTVTPTENPSGEGVLYWWVSAVSATGFTVNCDTAPNTDGMSFNWIAME